MQCPVSVLLSNHEYGERSEEESDCVTLHPVLP